MRASLLFALPPFALLLLPGCPSSISFDAGRDVPATDDVRFDAPSPIDADLPLDVRVVPDVPATGCVRHSDCVIRAESCCGSCGAATATDFIALHVDDVDDYVGTLCAGVPCPECAQPDDPMLVASCEAGRCVGRDLRLEVFTECSAPADCVLGPRRCCDCGLLGVSQTIAYNTARGNPYDLICDADAPACPPCVPTFDMLSADCAAGRCVVLGP